MAKYQYPRSVTCRYAAGSAARRALGKSTLTSGRGGRIRKNRRGARNCEVDRCQERPKDGTRCLHLQCCGVVALVLREAPLAWRGFPAPSSQPGISPPRRIPPGFFCSSGETRGVTPISCLKPSDSPFTPLNAIKALRLRRVGRASPERLKSWPGGSAPPSATNASAARERSN
jgi:hypothetical protein